ncbi:MAG: hypothetical protein IKQ22_03705 [Clostridia bacterium]|nr:hypothetical protein [Clostridia bacterium]
MTDEEMAEEYKRQFYGVTSLFSFSDIEQAFLAGLKARLQWHDLRKDPTDLPPRMGLGSEEVYVQYDTKGVTDFACYRFDKNIWERSEDDEQAVGVIAWCEIPTFDKEE